MKDYIETSLEKTNPALLNAHALMREYSQATGVKFNIYDHNFQPIHETQEELSSEKNCCLFCIKHSNKPEEKNFGHLTGNPCKEMHINAIKKSQNLGASYTYICPLRFIFWASPIYTNRRFIGALLGSGFLGASEKEICSIMNDISEGKIPEPVLMESLKSFPRAEPHRIKALTELMFICVQSLSNRNGDAQETMKQDPFQQPEVLAEIEKFKEQYSGGSPLPECLEEKELKLIEALRRGDADSGRQITNEILSNLFYSNSGELKQIRSRAIGLAVLLFRVGTSSPINTNHMPKKINQYINTIHEAKNIEELTDALYRVVDEKAEQIRGFHGMQHALSLKKAKDYIVKNLSRKINLEEIAKASGFSAPYFSTIFKEEMGENFSGYLNRLRVEKASRLLTGTRYNLSKIANQCGFGDQSWFSKTFKQYTGMSPGKYRSQGGNNPSS